MFTPEFVTILILIDGFLQLKLKYTTKVQSVGHNPYFNRWFSAISDTLFIDVFKYRSQSLF